MEALVVRVGALGDLLLLRRALLLLEGAGHEARLVSPPGGDVLVGPGPAAVRERLPWEGLEAARLLAGERARGPIAEALEQAAVVVAYTSSSSLRERIEERARRVLFVDPRPPVDGPHASTWLAEPLGRFLSSAPPEGDALPPDLLFSPAEKRAAEHLLSRLPPRFVAVHPGSGSPAKNWPPERFRAVADGLAHGLPWLLVLGPAELGSAAWKDPGRAVVARGLPLRVLGALLARAGLFLGNDSGVSHLAAAAGAPTLALFGPTDPALWAPVGRRVRCLRAADVAEIELRDVWSAAEELRLRSAAIGPPAD